GASRLAALLLPHIPGVCSVVAPGQPGAALRDFCKASRFQGTSSQPDQIRLSRAGWDDSSAAFLPKGMRQVCRALAMALGCDE
ncbi:MAG: hypothetical protein AB1806_11000, partial [Acidobacteriota bacterium]